MEVVSYYVYLHSFRTEASLSADFKETMPWLESTSFNHLSFSRCHWLAFQPLKSILLRATSLNSVQVQMSSSNQGSDLVNLVCRLVIMTKSGTSKESLTYMCIYLHIHISIHMYTYTHIYKYIYTLKFSFSLEKQFTQFIEGTITLSFQRERGSSCSPLWVSWARRPEQLPLWAPL